MKAACRRQRAGASKNPDNCPAASPLSTTHSTLRPADLVAAGLLTVRPSDGSLVIASATQYVILARSLPWFLMRFFNPADSSGFREPSAVISRTHSGAGLRSHLVITSRPGAACRVWCRFSALYLGAERAIMKSRVMFAVFTLAALLLIVDITRSLNRTGARCDECDGSLVVVGDSREQTQTLTYYCCERCQKYSVVTRPIIAGTAN